MPGGLATTGALADRRCIVGSNRGRTTKGRPRSVRHAPAVRPVQVTLAGVLLAGPTTPKNQYRFPSGLLREAFAGLADAITDDTTERGMAATAALADDSLEEQPPRYCTGLDGVSVELGPLWVPVAQQ